MQQIKANTDQAHLK